MAPVRAMTYRPPAVRSATGQGRPPRTRGSKTRAGFGVRAATCARGRPCSGAGRAAGLPHPVPAVTASTSAAAADPVRHNASWPPDHGGQCKAPGAR
jgi:hypothetical protein